MRAIFFTMFCYSDIMPFLELFTAVQEDYSKAPHSRTDVTHIAESALHPLPTTGNGNAKENDLSYKHA